jgi:AcrR family transcriptional regulator
VATRTVRDAGSLGEREQRILAAAAVAFREKGFHGVGMDELGARAGLSGPSLYRHFAGKDEILATLLNHAMDELLTVVSQTTEDAAGDLQCALRHHVRFALDQRDLVVLYQREVGNLAERYAPAFAARMGHYTRRWEQLVARRLPGLGADQVSALAQVALGTVFSASTWPARARRVGGPEVVEELLLGVLQHGLAGGAVSAT